MDDRPPCETCGQQHIVPRGSIGAGRPSCSAHSAFSAPGVRRPAPKPCGKLPMTGQSVCRSHGGATGHAKAAALARIQRQEAERLMATYADPDPDVDPGDILLDLIVWGRAKVKFYRAQVLALEPEDVVWGMTKRATGGKDKGDTHEAKPNLWTVLLREAEMDLRGLVVDALKVGLKQREVDMAERLADRLMPMLDAVVQGLGHDPTAPDVAEKVERALRLVV